jgi:hypothetical protein
MRNKINRVFGRKNQLPKNSDDPRFDRYTTRQYLKMTAKMARLSMQSFWVRHKIISRLIIGFLVFLILFSIFYPIYEDSNKMPDNDIRAYESLLDEPIEQYAEKLQYDTKKQQFNFNEGYSSASDGVYGQTSAPKITATFASDSGDNSVSINDPVNGVEIKFTPKFSVGMPTKDSNRVIYPIRGKDALKVYTLKGTGVKEDIILKEKPKSSTIKFEYDVTLASGLELRIEKDGSLAAYGASSTLLGDIATSTESDAQLLEKARQNAEKNQLIFKIPAPVVIESNKKTSDVESWFTLQGNKLTLHARGLETANFPLSIDPTIYVESAQKLMRGNNETNIDFDTTNELIQKSQTTGARIDAWESSFGMNEATWDHSTAVAGGKIYKAGGRTGTTKPQVISSTTTVTSSGSTTFTMDMPAVRPAGDLYVALMCHDDNTDAVTPPAGWTEYADSTGHSTNTRTHAAYYKIGTDAGGGNEAATYNWTAGSSEQWAGAIIRVRGFNSGSPISGTVGLGANGSAVVPVFPAVTPSHDATLVIRAVGADEDQPSTESWVPTGHTKLASARSGTGGGACGFVAAALDSPPASGVSTGTATLADSSITDDYGASSIAIRPASVTPATQDSVYWASFNSTSRAIESPNPGAGVCDGWCTNSAYDLPEARRGFSMVAYNGFLYAIGGIDASGNKEATVFVAKLGANGEPQLWHPTGGTPAYWYQDASINLPAVRAYGAAVAYNNRIYFHGGIDATNTTSSTVYSAVINPTGTVSTWSTSGMTALPSARYGHTTHIYNDVMYLLGGNATFTGTPAATVHYVKLNANGNMNSWVSTTSFTTGRQTNGATFSSVWGAYIYLGGGCTAVNGSGYCTSVASDTLLASINADGSITEWNTILNLENQRSSYSFAAWQGGLYRLGGCITQNSGTGECNVTLADAEYGVINEDGDASTVSISQASGSGNCTGGDPYNCNIPNAGDNNNEIGHMLSGSVVLNGYLYVIGGCTDYTCSGTDPQPENTSGNIAYVAISSDGTLRRPAVCTSGIFYGSYCIDSQNIIYNPTVLHNAGTITQAGNTITGVGTTFVAGYVNDSFRYADGTMTVITARASNTSITVERNVTIGTAQTYSIHENGVAAPGITTFNGRIYLLGGLDGGGNLEDIYSIVPNADGTLSGGWATQDLGDIGLTLDLSYTYIYARANPSSAGTYPGNLFVFGGCGSTSEASCSGGDHRTEVYKCNIETTGLLEEADANDCTTTGQLQFDDGISLHSGAVYANYIYIIGGFTTGYGGTGDRDTVLYARFDDNNNVVAVSGGAWIQSPNLLSSPRRRGFGFGYNGFIYAVGGYDDNSTSIIADIEFAKINVSDGSIGTFSVSTVTINQRWGLTVSVSNSYAYVIGGCNAGPSPGGCTSFQPAVQTFQVYNNDSGAVSSYLDQSDQTFATDTDRIGASSVVHNGYIYVAGGCTNIGCTTVTDNVQVAPLSASDGTVGTWVNTTDSTMPAGRAWGQLEIAGTGSLTPTLYYIGGQDATGDQRPEVYYGAINSSGNVDSWLQATNGLPADRTQHGATVWNDRLYVVGGINGSGTATNTVYISPQLSNGGNITSAWSSDTDVPDVARSGNTVVAYANNLYSFGGFDGTNYLLDGQFTQINTDGTVDAWTFTTSLPSAVRQGEGFVANGYMYIIGGRNSASSCAPSTLIAPISANTTIATGNNPTGVGVWYETNQRYTGDRYGAAVAYGNGKLFVMGGGCSSILTTNRHKYGTVKSQPQVAKYSRMIDTDTDVFPNSWLMNGLDNSVGARWQVRYRTMHDTSDIEVNPNEDCGTSSTMPVMTTWGYEFNYGNVTLGDVASYVPRNGASTSAGTITQSGTTVTGTGTSFNSDLLGGLLLYADGTQATITAVASATSMTVSVSRTIGTGQTYTATGGNINCGRYFYFFVSIDASQTFGYPEDVDRGPTISDLSLFFTSDPSKRLRHGKTFTGGEQQPLDTPCRQSVDPQCPLP